MQISTSKRMIQPCKGLFELLGQAEYKMNKEMNGSRSSYSLTHNPTDFEPSALDVIVNDIQTLKMM